MPASAFYSKRKAGSQGDSTTDESTDTRKRPRDVQHEAQLFLEMLDGLSEKLDLVFTKFAVKYILKGHYAKEALELLAEPIKQPTGSPDRPEDLEPLKLVVNILNRRRIELLELCHAEVEAPTGSGKPNRPLDDRQRALQRGIEAPRPSDAAKHSVLLVEQAIRPMQIGRSLGTTGPPISIYHPIFSRFQTLVQGDDSDPVAEDVVAAWSLITAAADFYETEDDRLDSMNPYLTTLLGRRINGTYEMDAYRPDGVVFTEGIPMGIPLLVMEAENEIGAGERDPNFQAAFSYRKLWVERSRFKIRNACCCPGFVLSVAGPYITIHGGVYAGDFIVQPLTETLGLANYPAICDRARYIAKIMVALRTCLDELELFYMDVTPTADTKLMACRSPFFNEYDGYTLTYTSYNLLSDRIGRAMFDAEVKRDGEEQAIPVRVKFTTEYCHAAHELLARENLAPPLRHVRGLESGWIVVVMDLIPGKDLATGRPDPLPDRVREDVRKAVDLLHKEGFAFGDLRPSNIVLCERNLPDGGTEQGVMLVDFDWAGKAGEQRYPPSLNIRIHWPEGVKPGGIMKKEHDDALFEFLIHP
ncbi:hypothetical protein FRC01_005201 [Tulasnella sp. 417]|nr:hypothetical protein FRC01_005201 [Tulasnella sp. 417]